MAIATFDIKVPERGDVVDKYVIHFCLYRRWHGSFKCSSSVFYKAITTPVLDIQRRRYEDEEQENTRDRYSLASLLEANPQKYQRVQFNQEISKGFRGTTESHTNEYDVNLSGNEPSISGLDIRNEDLEEDIPQGVNGASNIEYGDALWNIFRMGDVWYPCTLNNYLVEAIFIPTGFPHQVRNRQSCIKVDLCFVSPDNVEECIRLTDEFRLLLKAHRSKEDKLEISRSLIEDMLPLVEESKEERSLVKMCDKKNCVLFTDIACFVLSHDIKLPDESQI
ncbi:hypothetical protein Tco_1147080 [Tanacetum coccineum]